MWAAFVALCVALASAFGGFLQALAQVLGTTTVVAAALLLVTAATGCAPQATELERFSNQVVTTVVVPAVEKALSETAVRTSQLQGGAEGIEPGYVFEFEGGWCTGVRGKALVYLKGVSGRISGSVQGDQGPDLIHNPPAGTDTSAAQGEPTPVG